MPIPPLADDAIIDAEGLPSVAQRQALAPRHAAHAVAVIALNLVSCPTTVSGFVMPVIVDSINGHALGTAPHVSEEVTKIIPSLTDRNAASAVAMPLGMLGVVASPAHVLPRFVFSRMIALPAMHEIERRDSFDSEASATLRGAATERASVYQRRFAAVASTTPEHASATITTKHRYWPYSHKPSVAFARPIDTTHRSLR